MKLGGFGNSMTRDVSSIPDEDFREEAGKFKKLARGTKPVGKEKGTEKEGAENKLRKASEGPRALGTSRATGA